MAASSHEQLQAEFNAYRRRSEEQRKQARLSGRDEAVEALLDIIDDCDRAIAQIARADGDAGTLTGIRQLRDRMIRHFAGIGYTAFGAKGERFDPQRHDAIAVEAGEGADGTILKVHRRGWERHDGKIVRAAMVTVLRGSTETGAATSLSAVIEGLDEPQTRVRRRRPRPPAPAAHLKAEHTCPYGLSDCTGDCPGCASHVTDGGDGR